MSQFIYLLYIVILSIVDHMWDISIFKGAKIINSIIE